MTEKNWRHKKSLGQHFLSDFSYIQTIVQAIAPNTADHLFEIGPGQGAITLPILERKPSSLTLIELDDQLAKNLATTFQDQLHIKIINQDALTIDWPAIIPTNEPARLYGNLPYQISSPLLLSLLPVANRFTDYHFMLQKEMVLRISADVGNTNYSRLTVMLRTGFNALALFEIPPDAFTPPPKVDSMFLRLTPKTQPLVPAENWTSFQAVVKQAFSFRRKTLSNALKKIIDADSLKQLDIDPSLRPQNITPEQYAQIAAYLNN